METFIRRLPEYIGKEIFQYIVPSADSVQFREHTKNDRFDHFGRMNPSYEIAYFKKTPMNYIENREGAYLSRIHKKNGKHRYYLTTPTFWNDCTSCGYESNGCGRFCRGSLTRNISYKSIYLGKDIKKILFDLSL